MDEEDKVKVAGGFLVQVLPGAKEEEIARFEKRIQEMPAISTLLESDDHIEALLKAIYGDEAYKRLSEEEIRFQCASLPSSDLQEMKEEDHGAEITCQFCQTTYNFDEHDLEELIRDKS
ncbi:heat shock protein 3HSP33 homolog [Streptococcus pneumoniae]|nr:heat shock protein 3HSP33 homolog [Streptococcus pneumoniae]